MGSGSAALRTGCFALPGARCTASGTRQSALSRLHASMSKTSMYGNFGKSERRHRQQRHWKRGRRRTRQDQISLGLKIAGEIADPGSAPNEESLFLLPDRFSRRANPCQNTIQPFDLMSRRHPLSSTRAVRFKICFKEANRRDGSRDVPASSRRQFSEARFLRLLCLLSFLGHVALLM